MASPVHCVSVVGVNRICGGFLRQTLADNIVSFSFCFVQGERATGYGVALLCAMFGNQTNNSLLQSIAPIANDEENSAKRIRRG